MNTKKCWRCQQTKDKNLFYKDRSHKDGLQACCKECTKRFNKNFKTNHPEYFKEKGKDLYDSMSETERIEYNKLRYQKTSERYKSYNYLRNQTKVGGLYKIWQSAKQRGKDFNRDFTITRKWVEETFDLQNGRCSLTGIDFEFKNNSGFRRNPWYPSVDRIDSSKGYTPENCRLVCIAMNLALCDFGEKSFERLARGFLEKLKNSQ